MSNKLIEMSIYNQIFRLACAPEDEANLREAVARVDAEMNHIAQQSNIRGMDRIAVMTAISLSSKLLELEQSIHHGEHIPVNEVTHTLEQMNTQLNNVLNKYLSQESSS